MLIVRGACKFFDRPSEYECLPISTSWWSRIYRWLQHHKDYKVLIATKKWGSEKTKFLNMVRWIPVQSRTKNYRIQVRTTSTESEKSVLRSARNSNCSTKSKETKIATMTFGNTSLNPQETYIPWVVNVTIISWNLRDRFALIWYNGILNFFLFYTSLIKICVSRLIFFQITGLWSKNGVVCF